MTNNVQQQCLTMFNTVQQCSKNLGRHEGVRAVQEDRSVRACGQTRIHCAFELPPGIGGGLVRQGLGTKLRQCAQHQR
jgi:hypothetical protein